MEKFVNEKLKKKFGVDIYVERNFHYLCLYLDKPYNKKAYIEITKYVRHYECFLNYDNYVCVLNLNTHYLGNISHIPDVKENHFKIIMYFRELKNIQKEYNYIIKIFTTDYLLTLSNAYTFLLCNHNTKTFPRDIAKLIAHKILFFLPPKKLKK